MTDIFGDGLFVEFERERKVHTEFTDTGNYSIEKESNVSGEYSAIFNQSDGDRDHLEADCKSDDDNDSNQGKIVSHKHGKSSKKLSKRKISNLIKNDSLLFNAKHSTLAFQNRIPGEDEAPRRIRPAKNKLVLRIVYSNHKICRKLRGKLEKFLKENFSQDNVDEDDSMPTKVDGVVDFFSTYCKDSKGQPVYIEPGTTEGWIIPAYNQDYKVALPNTDEEEVEPLNIIGIKRDKATTTCFNCGENHMLNECQIPLDKHRINQNRKEFLNKFGNKQSRYHIEDDPRFSKFKPGVISNSLRKALNLNELELPLFIYRMRLYGYPPGYQKSAEVECSGINVYDSEGKAMSGDQLVEEGELTEPGEKKTTYDISKLIEYPGYNVDPPPGTIDNHAQFSLPAMLESHKKSAQESYMKARAADHLKRRRSKVDTKKSSVPINREELDMDVDAFESDNKEIDDSLLFIPPLPPTPDKPPIPNETPPSTPGRYDSDDSSINVSLNISHTSTPATGTSSDAENDRRKSLKQPPSETDSPMNSSMSSSISEMISTPHGAMMTKRFVSRNTSKALNLGTPVVTSHSPYDKLPDATKFSDSITPHMDFENLPDATGKFDKLRGLLNVVRSKLQNSANQDS